MADLIPYSIDPEEPLEDAIPYSVSTVTTIPPGAQVASSRAEKWDFALGDKSPGKKNLYDRIVTGNESVEARLQMFRQNQEDAAERALIIQKMIENRDPNIPTDVNTLQGMLFSNPPRSEEDFFAKEYAKRMTNISGDTFLKGHQPTEQDYTILDQAQKVMHLKEGTQKLLEDMEARYKATGWDAAAVTSNAERFLVSSLHEARMKTGYWTLRGTNLREQYDYYMFQDDPSKALAEIRKSAEAIYAKNPHAAMEYLQGFAAYSTSQAMVDNLFTIINIPLDLTLAKPIAAALGGRSLARYMRGVVQSTGNRTTDIAQVLEAMGETDMSAHMLAQRILERKQRAAGLGDLPGSTGTNSFEELRGQTTMMQSGPLELEGQTLALSRERARRIVEMIESNKLKLEQNIAGGPIRIQRLEEGGPAMKEAVRLTDESFNSYNPYIADRILDVRTSGIDETLTSNRFRVYQIGEIDPGDVLATTAPRGKENLTVTIGDPYLRPFKTEESAIRAANEDFKFGLGWTTKEVSGGWVIEVVKAIDETRPSVRKALEIETRGENPNRGIVAAFKALLPLSKDSKRAEELMESAKVVGYGTKNQIAFVKSFLQPIKDLEAGLLSGAGKKKSWEDFMSFLDAQRLYTKDGQFGRFSRNLPEFEKDWHAHTGRMPTEAEHKAYWSYVQLSDVDWIINNLNIYRGKTREGWELHSFGTMAKPFQDPHIEGKRVDNLPWDSLVNLRFAIWEDDPKLTRIFGTRQPRPGAPNLRENLNAAIERGEWKVIQLGRYSEKRLRDEFPELPAGRIDYVLTRDLRSSPLEFQQIPYQPGGHHLYEYQWYMRQPELSTTGDVRQTTMYRGDINFAGFNTEKEGRIFLGRMEEARKIMNTGDERALEIYLQKNLPFDTEHFKRFFKENKGQFDKDTPFELTPANVSVDNYVKLVDRYKDNPNHVYLRAHESPLNTGQQLELKYATERGDPIYAVENIGTMKEPAFNYQRGKMMNPMAAAERAATNIANSVLLDDFKIKATERFIAEFSDTLVGDLAELRRDPMKALVEGNFRPDINSQDYLIAQSARRSTLELLNIQSDAAKWINAKQQQLFEMMPKGARESAETLTPEWMLSTIKSPTKALRHVAFNIKQGLFNPAAIVNQAQIVSHIAGMEGPVRALRAGISGQYMSMLRFWENDPRMIEHFAAVQAKTAGNMSKEHFIEAFEALKRSGFHKVDKETSDYADWAKAGTVDTKAGAVLEWGKMFYKRGEELGRYTGWAAAYDRWRTANPTAVLDSVGIGEILQRADLLNLNMSGVSNSVLQKGIPGIITQFFSAHLRQAEQIWGNRLTGVEKARIIATNSLLYGLPVGAGPITYGLWPLKPTVNETILSYDWKADDHLATDLLINGLYSVMGEQAGLGKTDFSNLGLGGISFFRDLWLGEKHAGEVFAGVSGRTISDLIKGAYPFAAYVATGGQHTITQGDLRDAAGVLSATTALEKMYSGIFLGKYYGKGDQRVEDNITGIQGIINGLTGTQPLSVSTMYDIISDRKQLDKYQQKVEKDFAKNLRRAFEAGDNNDDANFFLYFGRAERDFARGGFTEDRWTPMFDRALNDSEPLVESVMRKYYERHRDPAARERWIKEMEKRGM